MSFGGTAPFPQNLMRQLANGAQITVLTTPPPGNNGRRTPFKEKLTLLETLGQVRCKRFSFNEHVHAKAYLFQDDKNEKMMVVGSYEPNNPCLRHPRCC